MAMDLMEFQLNQVLVSLGFHYWIEGLFMRLRIFVVAKNWEENGTIMENY